MCLARLKDCSTDSMLECCTGGALGEGCDEETVLRRWEVLGWVVIVGQATSCQHTHQRMYPVDERRLRSYPMRLGCYVETRTYIPTYPRTMT